MNPIISLKASFSQSEARLKELGWGGRDVGYGWPWTSSPPIYSPPNQTDGSRHCVCVCVCVCVCMCSVMSDSCNPMDCSPPDFSVHGDSLGKNRLPFLPQGIFPTRGSNPHLLYCRWILCPLSHLGSPADIISGHLGFQKKKGYWSVSEESRWVFWLIHTWISSR